MLLLESCLRSTAAAGLAAHDSGGFGGDEDDSHAAAAADGLDRSAGGGAMEKVKAEGVGPARPPTAGSGPAGGRDVNEVLQLRSAGVEAAAAAAAAMAAMAGGRAGMWEAFEAAQRERAEECGRVQSSIEEARCVRVLPMTHPLSISYFHFCNDRGLSPAPVRSLSERTKDAILWRTQTRICAQTRSVGFPSRSAVSTLERARIGWPV